MSDDLARLNIRIPKPLHEKAKSDAKSVGQNLQDYVCSLIEGGQSGEAQTGNEGPLALLTNLRSSDRFGDETILQEILRRVVSIQLLDSDRLADDYGPEAASETLLRLDDVAEKIIDQR